MSFTSEIYQKIKDNIHKVIIGKDDVIDLLLISLFTGGHVLLEDVPGTGKTMLVKSLAASVDCDSKRIQFTPDLLPSDITGINYFNMKTSEFQFVPGPVFSNILLSDEINRATPKTQAGLLECMEELQATIDGTTYPLSRPFMVIATQNPVENLGVFPLPEAQLDRFLVKTAMGYPTHREGVAILDRFGTESPLSDLTPVASKEDIAKCRDEVADVYVHEDIMSYIISLTEATREPESVLLGVSPRGGLALLRVAKGYAAISGRNYVTPDDVKKAAPAALPHRLTLTSTAKLKKNAAERLIDEILDSVPVPTESALGWAKA